MTNKFNPKKLEKLNNPERLKDIPPSILKELVGLNRVDTLVDVGAGTGFFSVALCNEFKCSKVYACDLSEVMLEWMKENIVPNYPEIIPVKSKESGIPLESEIADIVFMISLHHELEDPISLLKETFRLLKVGGKILIIDWKKEDMEQGPPKDIRCTSYEVSEQLIKVGFEDVKTFEELEKHFIVIGEKKKHQP